MDEKKFSERLSIIMDAKGLRQADVIRIFNIEARRMGSDSLIGKSHISQWVNGVAGIGTERLFILASALDVRPEWLYGFDWRTK